MQINYVHNSDYNLAFATGKCTIAYLAFSSEKFFKDLARVSKYTPVPRLSLMLGIAKCHPEDQYNKKIGRQVAEENMEPLDLVLTRIYSGSEHYDYFFTCTTKKGVLAATIRVYKDSSNCRVVGANLVDY